MANLAIYKFRFPESLDHWQDLDIPFYEAAGELLDGVSKSEHALILCGLDSKDDLLQIISFYQKKRVALKGIPHSVVLVDFQGGGKLLEAAQRLTVDKLMSGEEYFANEGESLSQLAEDIENRHGKQTSHQTYEDLFAGPSTVILKKNTKRRLYPVEEVTEISSTQTQSPMEVMTESPVVSFKLYEGEKLIESTFVDYFDREIYLRSKELPEDNNLILEFKFSYLSEKKGLRLKTEVISIEEDEGEYQLTLRVESHLKELEVMFKVFQKREQNIAQFLKKVKGH